MELSATLGKSAADADASVNKQATGVLNQFLEEFYKPKQVLVKTLAFEGRLDFSRLTMGGALGLPRSFSRGLPPGVLASWDGAWQVLPAAEPHEAAPGRRLAPRAVIRLNGAIGSIRFSRPVVVRSLVMRPPTHAAEGQHWLWIRARKAGTEVWRQDYPYDAAVGAQSPGRCVPGDLVLGRWEGNGRLYMARILTLHERGATVFWLDNDPSHRLVPWEHLTSPGGKPCRDGQSSAGGSASSGAKASRWRDLARRTKAIDEISFLVTAGSEGWLLAELGVAAVKWRPEADAGDSDEAVASPADTSFRVVQVMPGPHAKIEDVSHAAVFYHADDMLERGFRLSSWSAKLTDSPLLEGALRDALLDAAGDELGSAKGDTSSRLRLSSFRSVEGLKQLVRGLAEDAGRPSVSLPAHVSRTRVLSDLSHFVNVLNLDNLQPEDQEKVVNRYGHFEVFFSDLWDWRTSVDSLQVLYERWRHNKAIQQESKGVFHQGQSWVGSYYCTQGRTKLSLDVTEWEVVDGQETLRADLTFTIVSKTKTVTGQYEVQGRLEPIGRSLILEPIPDSWKERPKNFVMVGLQGVVSATDSEDTGLRVFAGTVPIFGCDSFQLVSQVADAVPLSKPPLEEDSAAEVSTSRPWPSWQNSPWNGALVRLSQAIDTNRQLWRKVLQKIIKEKSSKKSATTKDQVSQLLQAARSAGMLSFEMTTADGEEIIVKLR